MKLSSCLYRTAAGFQVSQLTIGGSGSSHSVAVISTSSQLSDQQALVLDLQVTSNFGELNLLSLCRCIVSVSCLMGMACLETEILVSVCTCMYSVHQWIYYHTCVKRLAE